MARDEDDKATGAGKKKYSYFVDDVKYDSDEVKITGVLVEAKLQNLPAGYILVPDAHGHADDTPVTDATVIDLEAPHGHPHLFLTPPANSGTAGCRRSSSSSRPCVPASRARNSLRRPPL